MDDLDYGANVVDQVTVFVSIVFERRFSFRKYLEYIIRRTAVLEFVRKRMVGKVYSCLLGVAL